MRSFPSHTLVCAALLTLGCGAAENFENAKSIGSNIRTMMNMQEVAVALERHRAEHGTFPAADSMAALRVALGRPLEFRGVDRWGEELLVSVTPEGYVLTSKGEDRVGGHEFGGAVTTPGHSITLKDGRFEQYHAKVEKTARKIEGEIAAARGGSASAS